MNAGELVRRFGDRVISSLGFLTNSVSDSAGPIRLGRGVSTFHSLHRSLNGATLLLSKKKSLNICRVNIVGTLRRGKLLPRVVTKTSSKSVVTTITYYESSSRCPDLVDLRKVGVGVLRRTIPRRRQKS